MLHRVIDLCDQTHHLVWTTRPAPLREGLQRIHLQDTARGFPDFREVKVDTSKLSIVQKSQILYRHARAAGLSEDGLELVRRSAREVVGNPNFTPLRVARYVNEELPGILATDPKQVSAAIEDAVKRGITTPTPELQTSFAALDYETQIVLTSMLDFPGGSVGIDDLADRAERLRGGPLERSIEETLALVEDHFIRSEGVS